MEKQRRSKHTMLLAGCVFSLFAGGNNAISQTSGPVSCFVGSGQSRFGMDPVLGTSYGVQCLRGDYPYAWIACPGADFPLECYGTYRAVADGRGIACYDSGGFPSPDSPQYCPRDGGGG